ncbi:hypothetical protein [Anaerosphaera multitolerans]|nr:hypothetical protein [Anaerosphaera multitolerans]
MNHLETNEDIKRMEIKGKAVYAVNEFKRMADDYGIILKLRKK